MPPYAPPLPEHYRPLHASPLEPASFNSTRYLGQFRSPNDAHRIDYESSTNAGWVILRAWNKPTNLLDNARFARQFATQRIHFWETIMAKKLTTAKAFERVAYQGFLERPMSDVELEECDGWHAQPNEIFELIEAVTQDAYQLTISYSQERNEGTATLMDRNPKRKTGGWMLSSKGENCADALKLLLFKHFQLLQRDWDTLAGATRSTRRG